MASPLLSRLLKSDPRSLRSFQVVVQLCTEEPQSSEMFEQLAEEALDILLERSKNEALGPVVGCDFSEQAVEIEFTVEAASAEELHQKVGHVLRTLEEHGSFGFKGSTASPLETEPESEAILA